MCDICASGLVEELNKKRNWRPDRVIKWAGRRGLSITESELQAHFAEHLPKPEKQVKAKSIHKSKPETESPSSAPAVVITPVILEQADNRFLDEIVKRVFNDLIEGKFELKLEHGFKAIEIKQKLADKADTENMLMELLNEIRNQELTQ
jgi:hypothetical protein